MTPRPTGFAPIVVAWVAALACAYLADALATPQAQAWAEWTFAIYPVRYDPVSGYAYSGLSMALLPLISHAFLHGGLVHIALNAACLVQAGVPLARRFGEGAGGGWRFSLLFILSVVAGAVAYILLNPGSDIPAVGASGGVSGVFAAFFLSVRPNWRESLRVPLVHWGLIIFFVVNVGLASLGQFIGTPIAWEAHLGGFLAGLILQPVLAPRTPHAMI
ncbi:MAG: rhomboid family intramembrane serine protease [Caulobacterales bacterium]